MLQAQKQIVQLQRKLECSSIKVFVQSSMTCIKLVIVEHATLVDCMGMHDILRCSGCRIVLLYRGAQNILIFGRLCSCVILS